MGESKISASLFIFKVIRAIQILRSLGYFFGEPIYEMAFASPDLVPKLILNLSRRRTFAALSSSGPFQELTTLASNHKLSSSL